MFLQKSLPFAFKSEYTVYDFYVSTSNVIAYKAVVNDIAWYNNRLMIIGESGSGKTHLIKIWIDQVLHGNAIVISGANSCSCASLDFSAYKAIALDDVQLFDEKELLYVINRCMLDNIKLLMTSSSFPICHTKDLQSRINSTYTILLKNPDNELLKVVLHKQLIDAQIKVPQDVIEYMVSRMPEENRTFSNIKNYVSILTEMPIKKKKKIDISVVRKILLL